MHFQANVQFFIPSLSHITQVPTFIADELFPRFYMPIILKMHLCADRDALNKEYVFVSRQSPILDKFKIFRRFTQFCAIIAIDPFKICKAIHLAKTFSVEFGRIHQKKRFVTIFYSKCLYRECI